jgi:hypothetical protein
MPDPVLDRGLTDVELTGGVVLGEPPSDRGNDGPTTSGIPVSLLMTTSGRGCGFSVQNTPERSGSAGTRLIGIMWHLAR